MHGDGPDHPGDLPDRDASGGRRSSGCHGSSVTRHAAADVPGRVVAQREIVTSLESALDARRQRIIISASTVNAAKWAGVIGLGILTLIAIACVHCANRRTLAVALTLFASAMVVSLLMIGVQDRPFAGPYHVKPAPLIQVEPQPAG